MACRGSEKPRNTRLFCPAGVRGWRGAEACHAEWMDFTQRAMAVYGDRTPGRIVVRADDPGLTPYAGLAVSGELTRRLGLAELIDAELAVERRARPVKVRRRGL